VTQSSGFRETLGSDLLFHDRHVRHMLLEGLVNQYLARDHADLMGSLLRKAENALAPLNNWQQRQAALERFRASAAPDTQPDLEAIIREVAGKKVQP